MAQLKVLLTAARRSENNLQFQFMRCQAASDVHSGWDDTAQIEKRCVTNFTFTYMKIMYGSSRPFRQEKNSCLLRTNSFDALLFL